MQLELKDLTSSQTFLVPEDGVTFGREGGDADVQFKDGGVSKRHARVYLDADVWYLEDLNSSNGTFLQTARIQQPTELMPGDIFSMSKVRFEVLQMVDGGTEAPPPPPPKKQARPSGKGNGAPQAAPRKPSGRAAAVDKEESAPRPEPRKASKPKVQEDDGGDVAQPKGIGYFFIAVPKAIAFYLAAIPLLLVNPVGTVKKSIEEQNHDPMGAMELIAYAIPPLLLSQLLASIATGIVLAVHGTFSIMSFIPVVPVISALIGAVITGFIWHPVLKWVINFLKGESDERSRTNYFLMAMTSSAVLAVPGFIATLLSLVPFRLISVVGVLLTIVAQLASLYIFWAWFTYFNVVKWFRLVILILGGLGVLGGLYGAVMVLIHPVATVGITSGDADKAIADAQKQAEEAMKAAGTNAEAIKEAQEKAQKAIEDAQKTGAAATKEAQKQAEAAAKAAKEAGDKAAKETKEAATKTAEAVKETKETVKETAKTDDKQPPPEKVGSTPPPPVTGTGYPAWAQMRDSIEKRITDDPTLLTRVSGLGDLYKDYEAKAWEAEQKALKATSKHPQDARYNAHLRDAELYQETDKLIRDIYGKLPR